MGSADAPAATAPFPVSRHQIVESADQEQSKSGVDKTGLSEANTHDICHGDEGVRMILGSEFRELLRQPSRPETHHVRIEVSPRGTP
jgi:hypothetical protein